jgi:methyl-accepting chemotaxis protein
VRKLAEESGEAAKNIADIVKLIQNSSKLAVTAMAQSSQEVEEGRSLISEINQDIDGLMLDVVVVADRSKRISNELTSQNTHIENIENMIHSISHISQETAAGTQEVSASSEEQTATMESISLSAQELATLAEGLNELVSKFKI